MNIYELSNKSGASLADLRKLEKLKVLKIDPEGEAIQKLRFHMARNMQFTLPMLLQMLDEPDLIDELGWQSKRYERRAREQLAALGDIQATSAPREVTAEIPGANYGDEGAALMIAEWLKSVLPVEPVGYHWVAARLLAPLNQCLREQYTSKLSLALLNVRKLPEFADHWRSEKIGTRKTIRYFRPENLPFDL